MCANKMRPFRHTITLTEALEIIIGNARPVTKTELVQLARANGRVLARDVQSSVNVPPFDRAAMDGYALISEDAGNASPDNPCVLQSIETVHTGNTPTQKIQPGTCTEIATGAPIPDGADAVIMVEQTEQSSHGSVKILAAVKPQQNIGQRGADIKIHEVILKQGDRLTPSRLGAIAALGIKEVEVFVRPVVTIFSTGNEIVPPGQPLRTGQIYDINRFTLGAVIEEHGGQVKHQPTSIDTLESLTASINACADSDIFVLSGGSSVGERDLTVDAIKQLGTVLFHGVAVKPGKPTVFGRIGDSPVFGMPGYPTSCLSNAYMLLVPLLRRRARLPEHKARVISATLSKTVFSTRGRHQFYPVKVVEGEAIPAFRASGNITSMSKADGFIEIASETETLEKGSIVDVTFF